MKKLLLVTFLISSITSYSQDYNFKPKWKIGDEKKITISQSEKEYENGELISDTVVYNEASIKVLEESDTDYTLEILFVNQALDAALAFYDKLDEELVEYRNLKLIYSINKETAKTELMNWEESQEFMNGSFDAIKETLDEKAPDVAPMVGFVFMPLVEAFKSKENIEAYMQSHIEFILAPYNKDFKLGETIITTETEENPFNPRQDISATTKLTLESIDKKNNTYTIKQEVILDLSQFIEMIKGMMQGMGEAFGASDSTIEEKSKEMDDFEMDVTNIQIITFDLNSTWVTKAVSTGIVSGTDPRDGTKTKKEVIVTRVVK